MSSRLMGILATLAATILFVGTLIAVAGPLFHFALLAAENLGERMGWISAGWEVRHEAIIWWADGIFDTALALGAGILLFPRLLAADADLERRRPPRG